MEARIEEYRGGPINLESGRWFWNQVVLRSLPSGEVVSRAYYFIREGENRDVLDVPVPASANTLSEQELTELARNPRSRRFVVDGVEWYAEPTGQEDTPIAVMRASGGRVKMFDQARPAPLGDLGYDELVLLTRWHGG